jgi:hypothetical protein
MENTASLGHPVLAVTSPMTSGAPWNNGIELDPSLEKSCLGLPSTIIDESSPKFSRDVFKML